MTAEPTETTMCDCCGSVVDVSETETCTCGAVVCMRCMDNQHYQCEDER